MSARAIACEWCRYWDGSIEAPKGAGLCRRHAPVTKPESMARRLDSASPVSTQAFWAVWPVTLRTNTCGDFSWRDFAKDGQA